MNGTIKFHKPNGPAFNEGEIWKSCSGNIRVVIKSTRRIGDGKFDYVVSYSYLYGGNIDSEVVTKDSWAFQVRYKHIADDYVR